MVASGQAGPSRGQPCQGLQGTSPGLGECGAIMSPQGCSSSVWSHLAAPEHNLTFCESGEVEGDNSLLFLLPFSDIYARLIRGLSSFSQVIDIWDQGTCWTAMKSSVL